MNRHIITIEVSYDTASEIARCLVAVAEDLEKRAYVNRKAGSDAQAFLIDVDRANVMREWAFLRKQISKLWLDHPPS